MRQRHFAIVTLLCFTVSPCALGQEGASITWESYKDIDFDFGDNLLRVDSDYQLYAFATGASPVWASQDPESDPILITDPITTQHEAIHAVPQEATASAIAGWYLNMDEFQGEAHLANSTAGTTAIADKYNPTVVAMSWASHTTSVEFGQEVSQGTIDWSPGILIGTGGGAFLSSYDTIAIHDPIVVWTRGRDGQLREPTKVFELNAVFDSETQFHWNEVRRIADAIDGPELVLVQNDGPFLDAGERGTGRFTLSLQSDLLPVEQRGTVSVSFENGRVTNSVATGVFQNISPDAAEPIGGGEGGDPALGPRLPTVGEPAKINALLPVRPEGIDRFVLNLDVGQDDAISSLAACSDGIHVSVGPAIDTIQTFTLNPIDRGSVRATTDAEISANPNSCLGDLREDADFLFGTDYFAYGNVSLHRNDRTSPIDRTLRLTSLPDTPRQAVIFADGEHKSHDQTRRWTTRFDVRAQVAELKKNDDGVVVEPITPIMIQPVTPGTVQPSGSADATSEKPQTVDRVPATQVQPVGVAVPPSGFVIGLLDKTSHRIEPADGLLLSDTDVAPLFEQKVDGFLIRVVEQDDETAIVQLSARGQVVAEEKLAVLPTQAISDANRWHRFELSLIQRPNGVQVDLKRLRPNGQVKDRVIRRTIRNMQLSDEGYRLALGTESTSNQARVHDFDNLITTIQQTGDLAWDGKIDRFDFGRMKEAVELESKDPFHDINLDGTISILDLEAIENLIPNKVPGDANFDGHVNFVDFLALSDGFGEETGLWSRGDFDSNGSVGFFDFLLLSRNFDRGMGGPTDGRPADNVPEPAANVLVLGACLCFHEFRRRRLVS